MTQSDKEMADKKARDEREKMEGEAKAKKEAEATKTS